MTRIHRARMVTILEMAERVEAAEADAIAEHRDPPPGAREVTREAIEARRAELVAARRPAGYRALAGEFLVSVNTIRRRLGTLRD